MIGKRSTGCPPKKVLKKRVSKLPTPCISDDPEVSMRTRSARSVPPPPIPSCQPTIATNASCKPSNKPPLEDSRCASSFHPVSNKSQPHKSISSKTFTVHSSYVMQNLDGSVVKGEMDSHPGDCNECEKNEPCGVNEQDQSDYCGEAVSLCTMSKASEKKSISNYLYDNPSLKSTTSKKVSACAEILDCMDDDSELWILQCPKSFDVNKLLNTNLNSRKSATSMKAIDTCCERFKCPINLICLAPEKAMEYKSVCDQIRLIQPKGKIMVTEQEELPAQSDMTCSERDQTDDECSQPGETTTMASMAESCAQLASKKVQKKLNDQRFTIETTVTVENVENERSSSKKAKKSMQGSCSLLAPPEPSPTKRKTKKS